MQSCTEHGQDARNCCGMSRREHQNVDVWYIECEWPQCETCALTCPHHETHHMDAQESGRGWLELLTLGLHYSWYLGMCFSWLPPAKAMLFVILSQMFAGFLLSIVFVQVMTAQSQQADPGPANNPPTCMSRAMVRGSSVFSLRPFVARCSVSCPLQMRMLFRVLTLNSGTTDATPTSDRSYNSCRADYVCKSEPRCTAARPSGALVWSC